MLEQNFNSLLYYGYLKGKSLWEGSLQDQLAHWDTKQEHAAGLLQQLFEHVPDQLESLLQVRASAGLAASHL